MMIFLSSQPVLFSILLQLDDVLREINEGYDNLRKTGVAGPLVVLKVWTL